jgi:hypothetical protein
MDIIRTKAIREEEEETISNIISHIWAVVISLRATIKVVG